MTNVTGENRAAEALMNMHLPVFESVLANAASDEALWNHRVKTFEALGLLDFQTASEPKHHGLDQFAGDCNGESVYVLPAKQLDEPILRRRLLRKLKAHRPSIRTRHRLQLHRDQVAEDKYRRDIAKVLTYKWVLNLEPRDMDMAIANLMDVSALEQCLDTFRLNDLSAANISSLLLRRSVNELLGRSEKLKARIDLAGAKMAFVQAEAIECIRRRFEQILEESKFTLSCILAETHANYDGAIADNRKRGADDAVAYAKKLEERAAKDSEDPQENFRRAVDRRLSRRKAARKRLARMRRRHPGAFAFRLASRMILFTVPLLLAFHIKMGSKGVSPVNAICRLFNWDC